jgi:precorrin-8X/cobalt-precorrin-8 methylmutase
MPGELSRHGDTTGNIYTDLGAETKEALEISKKSRMLARVAIGTVSLEDRVRQRCSVAVGDFSMAPLMRFCHEPVHAVTTALAKKSPVITDIRMVQVGIQKKGHDSEVICALDFGSDLAHKRGITRTSAGFIAMEDRISGSIVVIGNAPSALLALCDMVVRGIRPAVIIGTPVGFVNAAESKELLLTLDVPSITNQGTRGGTPVAVAAINECITIYSEACAHEGPGNRV